MFTPSELGAILLAAFAAFYSLRIFATTTAVIGLVGVVLIGTSGWLGRLLTDVTSMLVRLLSNFGATLLGSTVAGVMALLVYLIIRYAHGVHPNYSAGQVHAWIGVSLGALIVTGVTGIPQLAGLDHAIVATVGTLTSAIHG